MTVTKVEIKKLILDYMRAAHVDTGIDKFETLGVIKVCQDVKPEINGDRIRSVLSELKKENIITNLDERVPGVKGAHYFTLISIKEKKMKGKKMPEPSKKPFLPPTPPSPVAKMGSEKLSRFPTQLTLDEIKLNVDKVLQYLAQEDTSTTKQIAEISSALLRLGDLEGYARSKYILIRDIMGVQKTSLEAIESKVGEHNRELALLRTYLSDKFKMLEESVNPPVVSDASYRQGVRDGIQLAIDMGLTEKE